MPKNDKKKPAPRPAAPAAGGSPVTAALQAGKTKPMDAAGPGANKGGKGASARKGR